MINIVGSSSLLVGKPSRIETGLRSCICDAAAADELTVESFGSRVLRPHRSSMIGVMAPEPSTAPSAADLSVSYRAYLACLNARAWANLDGFVADDVIYNGQVVGLAGYRRMLERDTTEIPGLRFDLDLLVVDPPYVAARLMFDCTPRGRFLDLDVNGRRVSFSENVFYRVVGDKIAEVWSVIDKAAIERQL